MQQVSGNVMFPNISTLFTDSQTDSNHKIHILYLVSSYFPLYININSISLNKEGSDFKIAVQLNRLSLYCLCYTAKLLF